MSTHTNATFIVFHFVNPFHYNALTNLEWRLMGGDFGDVSPWKTDGTSPLPGIEICMNVPLKKKFKSFSQPLNDLNLK